MYRQPSTRLQNSTPKLAGQNPENNSQETICNGTLARTSSRYQVFEMLHALETERRCFSKVILESDVTLNITRSSDSFSTVPPIVNGGDWGCIVRDFETIIVLVLLAQFHPPKVTPLTNPAAPPLTLQHAAAFACFMACLLQQHSFVSWLVVCCSSIRVFHGLLFVAAAFACFMEIGRAHV